LIQYLHGWAKISPTNSSPEYNRTQQIKDVDEVTSEQRMQVSLRSGHHCPLYAPRKKFIPLFQSHKGNLFWDNNPPALRKRFLLITGVHHWQEFHGLFSKEDDVF